MRAVSAALQKQCICITSRFTDDKLLALGQKMERLGTIFPKQQRIKREIYGNLSGKIIFLEGYVKKSVYELYGNGFWWKC